MAPGVTKDVMDELRLREDNWGRRADGGAPDALWAGQVAVMGGVVCGVRLPGSGGLIEWYQEYGQIGDAGTEVRVHGRYRLPVRFEVSPTVVGSCEARKWLRLPTALCNKEPHG